MNFLLCKFSSICWVLARFLQNHSFAELEGFLQSLDKNSLPIAKILYIDRTSLLDDNLTLAWTPPVMGTSLQLKADCFINMDKCTLQQFISPSCNILCLILILSSGTTNLFTLPTWQMVRVLKLIIMYPFSLPFPRLSLFYRSSCALASRLLLWQWYSICTPVC